MFKQFFSSRTQSFKQITALIAILIVAIVGTILLTGSKASTPYISLNADQGTLANGATSQACSGASDGNCVKFVSCGSGNPGCTTTINPGASVANAVGSAAPGSVICLNPGSYSAFTLTKGGTAAGFITI